MAMLYGQNGPPDPTQNGNGAAPGPAGAPQQSQRIPQRPPNPVEQNMAMKVHRLEQQLQQLTNAVLQLQQRQMVNMNIKFNKDTDGRVDSASMIGKLV